MPASQRNPRYDEYGQPRPELSDARQELRKDQPQNQTQRALVQQILAAAWQQILRRGWYGSYTLTITVENGIIQQGIAEVPKRLHRVEE